MGSPYRHISRTSVGAPNNRESVRRQLV